MRWALRLIPFWMLTRSRPSRERELLLEIAALRQQLALYQRTRPKPGFQPGDRWLWAWVSRCWSGWKEACVLVKPETVIRWHRAGYRLFWRWKSRPKGGRPKVAPEVIALIRKLALENPT